MQLQNRIKSSHVKFFLTLFFLGIIVFFSRDYVTQVFFKFPFILDIRDWLGITADTVQTLGLITLIYFFIEIYEKNGDERKSKTPNIVINNISLTPVIPDNTEGIFCEATKKKIREQTYQIPAQFSENAVDYESVWEMLVAPPRQKDKYLKIELRNIQGNAKVFRLKLRLEYKVSLEAVQKITKNVLCPLAGITINGNETKVLFIKCGATKNEELKFLKVSIQDYICENIDGITFIGKENNFEIAEKEYQLLKDG